MAGASVRVEQLMRRFLPLLLLPSILAACTSDEDFTPTDPSGPSIPTIGGTYASDAMWRFDLTGGATPQNFTCGGGITITNQLGGSFSGTFFFRDANCAGVVGNVENGVLQTDGTVAFDLTVAGSNPNFLTAAFGCTYVSGDRGVRGTLRDNQLDAQATTVMDCGTNGILTVVTRLSGSR